jgi:hypothetical protein
VREETRPFATFRGHHRVNRMSTNAKSGSRRPRRKCRKSSVPPVLTMIPSPIRPLIGRLDRLLNQRRPSLHKPTFHLSAGKNARQPGRAAVGAGTASAS